MKKQVLLTKYAHFTYTETDTMPIYELNSYFDILQEVMKEASGEEEDLQP